jgi:hypothetical protein
MRYNQISFGGNQGLHSLQSTEKLNISHGTTGSNDEDLLKSFMEFKNICQSLTDQL